MPQRRRCAMASTIGPIHSKHKSLLPGETAIRATSAGFTPGPCTLSCLSPKRYAYPVADETFAAPVLPASTISVLTGKFTGKTLDFFAFPSLRRTVSAHNPRACGQISPKREEGNFSERTGNFGSETENDFSRSGNDFPWNAVRDQKLDGEDAGIIARLLLR